VNAKNHFADSSKTVSRAPEDNLKIIDAEPYLASNSNFCAADNTSISLSSSYRASTIDSGLTQSRFEGSEVGSGSPSEKIIMSRANPLTNPETFTSTFLSALTNHTRIGSLSSNRRLSSKTASSPEEIMIHLYHEEFGDETGNAIAGLHGLI
jgi:hypothetical protein